MKSRSLLRGALLATALFAARAGVAADLAVTLGDGPSDDVMSAVHPAIGAVGLDGGQVRYVSVITGTPQDTVSFALPLPACVSLPRVMMSSPVTVMPAGTPAHVTLEAGAIRVDGIVLPASGSVLIEVSQLTIGGNEAQSCCTRATVTDGSGHSVRSVPTDEAAGTACGSGHVGFFIHDPSAPAPAAE